jgi:hypothetical protein
MDMSIIAMAKKLMNISAMTREAKRKAQEIL